jgi:hypothetical protein
MRPPNYAGRVPAWCAVVSFCHRRSRARQLHSDRHSLVVQIASKASMRSFGWFAYGARCVKATLIETRAKLFGTRLTVSSPWTKG